MSISSMGCCCCFDVAGVDCDDHDDQRQWRHRWHHHEHGHEDATIHDAALEEDLRGSNRGSRSGVEAALSNIFEELRPKISIVMHTTINSLHNYSPNMGEEA